MQFCADHLQFSRQTVLRLAAQRRKRHASPYRQLAHHAQVDTRQVPGHLPLAGYCCVDLLLCFTRVAASDRLLPGDHPWPGFPHVGKIRRQQALHHGMHAALPGRRRHRHALGLRFAQQHLFPCGFRVAATDIRVHTRQHYVVATAHQREIMPPLIPRDQLYHLPGNTRPQAQAQATVALVGGVEVALQRRDDRGHRVEQAHEVDRDVTRHRQQLPGTVVQQVGQVAYRRRPTAEAEQVELQACRHTLRVRLAPTLQLPGNHLQRLGYPGFHARAATPGGRGIHRVGFTGQGADAFHVAFEKDLARLAIGRLRRVQRMQQGYVAQRIGITAAVPRQCRGVVLIVTGAIEEHPETQGYPPRGRRTAVARYHLRALCLTQKHKQAPVRRQATSGNRQAFVRVFHTPGPLQR